MRDGTGRRLQYRIQLDEIALFFMGEYANMIAGSAMMVTLFFWRLDLAVRGLDQPAANILTGFLHIGIFLGKVAFLLEFHLVRWMLPRFSVRSIEWIWGGAGSFPWRWRTSWRRPSGCG